MESGQQSRPRPKSPTEQSAVGGEAPADHSPAWEMRPSPVEAEPVQAPLEDRPPAADSVETTSTSPATQSSVPRAKDPTPVAQASQSAPVDFKPLSRASVIDLMKVLSESPESADELAQAAERVFRATNAEIRVIEVEEHRRLFGIKIGAGLSALNIVGGIALLCAGVPAAPAMLLFTLGAACTGATFAVITGERVSMRDFARLLGKGQKDDKDE